MSDSGGEAKVRMVESVWRESSRSHTVREENNKDEWEEGLLDLDVVICYPLVVHWIYT